MTIYVNITYSLPAHGIMADAHKPHTTMIPSNHKIMFKDALYASKPTAPMSNILQ